MKSTTDIKKSRGRPATGRGHPVLVRLSDEQLASVDAFRDREDDRPTRPEAVRRLVEKGLKAEQS